MTLSEIKANTIYFFRFDKQDGYYLGLTKTDSSLELGCHIRFDLNGYRILHEKGTMSRAIANCRPANKEEIRKYCHYLNEEGISIPAGINSDGQIIIDFIKF